MARTSMATCRLSLKDLKRILPELHSICDKWYNVGLQLDLSVDYLEELDSKLSTTKIHVSTCLKRVLVEWLKSNQATWQALVQALNSDLVKGKRIADIFRRKYTVTSLVNRRSTNKTIGAGGDTKRSTSQKNRKTSKTSKSIKRVGRSSNSKRKYNVELPDSFPPEDFVNMPPADRLCIKCGRVPRSPQKSTCCNQLYCWPCSLKNRKCWSHKAVIKYTGDGELRDILSKLTRKCPNQRIGCNWKGCGWQLSRHLSEKCPKTSSTGKCAKQEESHTDNSATASAIPPVALTSMANVEDEENTDNITTQSTNKQFDSKQGTHNISAQLPNSLQERESCYLLKTPPLNFAMENVSEYIDSDGAWLSDCFFSHQIGYKICLIVRIESSSEDDGMLNVILGVTSVEGPHNAFLVFPCNGFVKIMILNPMEDHDHQVLELMFVLEKPSSCNEIAGEVVKVPQHFITPVDCLFFQVEKIDMDKKEYRLWLLDASLTEDKQCMDGESCDDL